MKVKVVVGVCICVVLCIGLAEGVFLGPLCEALPERGPSVDYVHAQAKGYFHRKDYQGVIDTLGGRLEDPDMELHLVSMVAASYLHLQDYGNALRFYKRARSIIEKHGDKRQFHGQLFTIYRNLGYISAKKGLNHQAISFYESALRYRPRDVETIKQLYYSYQKESRVSDAIELLRKALRAYPSNALLHKMMGASCLQSKRPHAAIQHFQKALRNRNKDYEIFYFLGRAYELVGNSTTALQWYRRFLARCSDNAKDQYRAGEIYIKLNQFPEAVQCFRRVLSLQPDNFRVKYNIGAAHFYLGDKDLARKYYRGAIRIQPGLPYYRVKVPDTVVEKKDSERAQERSRQQSGSSEPSGVDVDSQALGKEACVRRARALVGEGRYHDAQEMYDDLVSRYPEDAALYFALGVLHEYNSKGVRYGKGYSWKRAVAYYEKAIEQDLNYAQAYCNLGALCLQKDVSGRAVTYLKKAVEIKKSFPLARYNLAIALEAEGRWHEALEHFRQLDQEKNAFQQDVTFHCGFLCKSLGDYESALNYYDRYVRRVPNDADGHFNIGLLYAENVGDKGRARHHFQRYLELEPNADQSQRVREYLS